MFREYKEKVNNFLEKEENQKGIRWKLNSKANRLYLDLKNIKVSIWIDSKKIEHNYPQIPKEIQDSINRILISINSITPIVHVSTNKEIKRFLEIAIGSNTDKNQKQLYRYLVDGVMLLISNSGKKNRHINMVQSLEIAINYIDMWYTREVKKKEKNKV